MKSSCFAVVAGLLGTALAEQGTQPPSATISASVPGALSRSGINAPKRLPSLPVDTALARGAEFFRQHDKSAPKYQLVSVRWVSNSDREDEDCWVLEWATTDAATRPLMRMVLVFTGRVMFGGYA